MRTVWDAPSGIGEEDHQVDLAGAKEAESVVRAGGGRQGGKLGRLVLYA
jgi:hypothetical protein